MKHKVKTIEGLARLLGKERFLSLAGYYTNHVKATVSDTIYEMSSRWYDKMGGILESEKMILGFNSGHLDRI